MRYRSYLRGELVGGVIGTLAFLIVLAIIFWFGLFGQVDWNTVIVFAIADLTGWVFTLVGMLYMYKRRILR